MKKRTLKKLFGIDKGKKIKNKEGILTMLASEEVLKKDWDNEADEGGMMFEQKEIVLMPFPYSDLTGSVEILIKSKSYRIINSLFYKII